MRTSKDIQIQDDPSNAAKNHIFYQTVLAFLRDRPQNVPRAYCITASVWLYSSKVCHKIPATSSARVCTLEHQFWYSSLSSLSCNMSCCTLQALRPSCTLHLGPSALFVQVANAIECWHCRCWGPMVLS